MEDTNLIYVTTDLHIGHDRSFLLNPRGYNTIEEHAAALIANWNSVVTPDDEVYILGDCVLNDDDYGVEVIKQLNGKKYLAIGNHDTDNRIKRYRDENLFEDIQFAYRLRYGRMQLYLSHYPTMVGNPGDPFPTYNISGHTHSQDRWENWDKCIYNASLDAHNMTLVSLEQIREDIRARRI